MTINNPESPQARRGAQYAQINTTLEGLVPFVGLALDHPEWQILQQYTDYDTGRVACWGPILFSMN